MSARSAQAELSEQSEPDKPSPSGRLLLRMPRSLHGELARAAEREGISLNQFITAALSSKVGWQDETGGGAPPRAAEGGRSPSRAIAIALIANVVVVGLAGAAAIAILLLAWLG